MVYASPTQLELLARTGKLGGLPTLRRAFSTTSLLPAHTARAFEESFGVRVTQVYGVIEVGLPLWNDRFEFLPSSLGVCRAPYEQRVVSEDGQAVAAGEVGELLLRGPGCFSGYLIGSDAGVQHPSDSWFATGDMVMCDEHGEITLCGRKKSVINCAGHKVFPEEVEAVLAQVAGVRDVRVVAESNPLLGTVVVAEIVAEGVFEGRSDTREKTIEELLERARAACHRELSSYKVPKEFRLVTVLPRTGSGKLIRYAEEGTA